MILTELWLKPQPHHPCVWTDTACLCGHLLAFPRETHGGSKNLGSQKSVQLVAGKFRFLKFPAKVLCVPSPEPKGRRQSMLLTHLFGVSDAFLARQFFEFLVLGTLGICQGTCQNPNLWYHT